MFSHIFFLQAINVLKNIVTLPTSLLCLQVNVCWFTVFTEQEKTLEPNALLCTEVYGKLEMPNSVWIIRNICAAV